MVEEVQASTDTEPRRESGRQARQARPRTPVGQQDDKFDFGKFIKGDLPGKLGTMLVRFPADASLTILPWLYTVDNVCHHDRLWAPPSFRLSVFWPPLKSRPGPSMHAACPATA